MRTGTINVNLSVDDTEYRAWLQYTWLLAVRFLFGGIPEGFWDVWDMQRPTKREVRGDGLDT